MNDNVLIIDPVQVRLDISTACQLRCYLCDVACRQDKDFLGRGMMSLDNFINFIEHNRHIKKIELANAGEALLNPHLPEMLRYAYEQGVTISLGGGVNMNTASDELLEALVRYQTQRIRIAVDGVTEETYQKYRKGGNLHKVLSHIQKLNEFKKKYRSKRPELILQCIIFKHNIHEIEKVRALGKIMNMKVFFRLNVFQESLEEQDKQDIRKMCGYESRQEFSEKNKRDYKCEACTFLWKSPQVNWNGRLSGCCGLITSLGQFFADDVLGKNFMSEFNNERMQYARKMLMGLAPPRHDIKCAQCKIYKTLAEHNSWYTPTEIRKFIQTAKEDALHPQPEALSCKK